MGPGPGLSSERRNVPRGMLPISPEAGDTVSESRAAWVRAHPGTTLSPPCYILVPLRKRREVGREE